MVAEKYSETEERLNVISHFIGALLSIVALLFLTIKSVSTSSLLNIFCFLIFGISLICLYSASTIYHNTKNFEKRKRLRIFDHISIYVLIAGSYTPFSLITLKDSYGLLIFIIIWTIAISGSVLKLFFTGRFKILSTSLYVFMGWIVIFAIKPLMNNLSPEGLNWLLYGGIFYTVGAILYSIKKINYNHFIFHIFVLFGSMSHFVAIYYYVL